MYRIIAPVPVPVTHSRRRLPLVPRLSCPSMAPAVKKYDVLPMYRLHSLEETPTMPHYLNALPPPPLPLSSFSLLVSLHSLIYSILY